MFAPDLGSLVLGEEIDRPHNGLFLTRDRHIDFGAPKIWLEETEVHNYDPKDQNYMLTVFRRKIRTC
jgi:hypothetical protein